MSAPRVARGRLWEFWGTLVVGVLAIGIVALYAGLWRGIWFDELLHFATGGMSLEYLLKTIDYTTIHVNHGQTGVYLLVDWALLQAFGASAVALRLPSLIAALVLLLSAVVFVRAKGFGWRWQAIVVMAVGANETLMLYTGEARPYMPLAGSSCAMLAYYALPTEHRRSWWGRGLGAIGFVLGALMHPYWPLMWAFVFGFSVAATHLDRDPPKGIRGVWKYLAPGFVICSAGLYLAVGLLTWMRRRLVFDWGPGEIYNWPAIISGFVQDHFSFVPYMYAPNPGQHPIDAGVWVLAAAAAVVLVTISWIVLFPRCRTRRLIAPAVLLGVGMASSGVASYVSYSQHYFIFERQWVAGMSLTAIAATWFFAEWWRATDSQSPATRVPAGAFVALVVVGFCISAASQAQITVDRRESWLAVARDTRTVGELMVSEGEDSFEYEPRTGPAYVADVNIVRGGSVWPELIGWYNAQTGMRMEYRDDTDSFLHDWTTAIWPDPSPEMFICKPGLEWQCPQP